MTFLPTILAWLALSAVSASPQTLRLECVRVLDGDCAEFRLIGRVHAVDAPEMKQLHGAESKKFLEEVLVGRVVNVTPLYRSYNRYVLTVDLGRGQDLGLVLVENGMAWVDPKYNKRKDYVDAQAEARREQVGLWNKPPAIEPWEFRKPTNPRVQ